ncbi:hypothetical protein ED28_08120 [[Pantoea] beijingensis]|uniref:TIGR02453 family protein n=1 Tax=[Pantoea] beijingensis TaxID=1324864 RepID=A0A443IE54_9GAMM|nr:MULTISPECIES: DUF2461 domain-containing protein [Erwiniaceae]RWR02336.1 hypothetical protein ED28_08120 [[Pantoea] beijingensis]
MSMFNGFNQEGLTFLQQLSRNNDKEWFEEHRHIYEKELLKPFRELVTALSNDMIAIDDLFEVSPAVGKTLSRMHRDTRFSHDKSPYRSNIWLTFKRARKNWTDAPTYFFEIGPDWWRYGLGYYSASRNTMNLFREKLANNPTDFFQRVNPVLSTFEVDGESYKRPLIKDMPEELALWYNKKSLALISNHQNMDTLFSSDLIAMLAGDFKKLSPLYQFLMQIEVEKKNQQLTSFS